MSKEPKCKKCRRAGTKLFLKGERCNSPNCALVKKSYPPGPKGKKGRSRLSEYGKELKEKQKLRHWYNLTENQFYGYVKDILGKGEAENASLVLVQNLETRLDNVVSELGFAKSNSEARQLVSHKHFLVNEKVINIPSYQLEVGDQIAVRPGSRTKGSFEKLPTLLKKHQVPDWLTLNRKELKGTIKRKPTLDDISIPVDISSIFEYYSR